MNVKPRRHCSPFFMCTKKEAVWGQRVEICLITSGLFLLHGDSVGIMKMCKWLDDGRQAGQLSWCLTWPQPHPDPDCWPLATPGLRSKGSFESLHAGASFCWLWVGALAQQADTVVGVHCFLMWKTTLWDWRDAIKTVHLQAVKSK